jgi:hypothetical protein
MIPDPRPDLNGAGPLADSAEAPGCPLISGA